MRDNLKILIGIAAYNAEKNVTDILRSLLNQKRDGFAINILLYSDCSTDKTVELANKINSDQVRVIDNRNRNGFAGAVKYILKEGNNYDATLILNDDIYIYDELFLAKLLAPLKSEGSANIGLIAGNPTPRKPVNFMERAGVSSFNIYSNIRYLFRDGNNKWTCDGKVLLFTRKFIESLKLPEDNNELGNVDGYMYFSCLENGFEYVHVRDAVVYYKMPSTLSDYLKWDARNKSNEFLLRRRFGLVVEEEYNIRIPTLIYYSLFELLKNPLGVVLLYFLRFYTKVKARKIASNFTSKWEVVTTTKGVNN